MRFRVPSELPSGVYMQGVGYFAPGSEFSIPAGRLLKYKPCRLLEPLDDDAKACMADAYKDAGPVDVKAKAPKGRQQKPKADATIAKLDDPAAA